MVKTAAKCQKTIIKYNLFFGSEMRLMFWGYLRERRKQVATRKNQDFFF